MAKYVKNGNNVQVIPDGQVEIRDKLPVGVYTVNESIGGFYLTKTDNFKLPDVVFGNVAELAKKIVTTFKDRQKSTGVLLSGLKGSGKTLLSKYVALELQKQRFPVLLINNSYDPYELTEFLKSINDECMVLFDEFEKNYKLDDDADHIQQENLMTLFDGTSETKKLFVLTCNDLREIHDMLLNRPGRMYYHIEHSGLSEDVIEEFCNVKLIDKTHIPNIVKIGALVGNFSFDMLDILVEEVNRYNIAPIDALSILNIKPKSHYGRYRISVYRGDELLKEFDGIKYDPLDDEPEDLCFSKGEVKRLKMEGLRRDDDFDEYNLSLEKDKIISIEQNAYLYSIGGYKVTSKRIRRTFDLTKLMN